MDIRFLETAKLLIAQSTVVVRVEIAHLLPGVRFSAIQLNSSRWSASGVGRARLLCLR
jgi:hypothetical protein